MPSPRVHSVSATHKPFPGQETFIARDCSRRLEQGKNPLITSGQNRRFQQRKTEYDLAQVFHYYSNCGCRLFFDGKNRRSGTDWEGKLETAVQREEPRWLVYCHQKRQ